MKIAIVAPACTLDRAVADSVSALAREHYPSVELVFHPQCFLSWGHFAGTDAERSSAFLEAANDPAFDAVWVARGGYGSNRLLETVLHRLEVPARRKTYLGYSDLGFLLAGLKAAGFPKLAHGPMPADFKRKDGEKAVRRALDFLALGLRNGFDPAVEDNVPFAAFNITILSELLGTPWQPDLSGHVLLLEDVSEHLYRIDRAMFHITSNPAMRKVRGIRLGRVSDIQPNDPDFAQTPEQIVRHWCEVSGIPYLGAADIGHDVENKIVPFGLWRPESASTS
ncbi:MAG: LD-carboxypeptidase [Alphaproteobacteria bacterium]|nr:LD-carboxypeptidase [Alphaproteobacteria bacterium]